MAAHCAIQIFHEILCYTFNDKGAKYFMAAHCAIHCAIHFMVAHCAIHCAIATNIS